MPQHHVLCVCLCVCADMKKKKLHMLKLWKIFQGSKVSGRAG